MNCPYCNREIPADTKFCPSCGSYVSDGSNETQSLFNADPQSYNQNTSDYQNNYNDSANYNNYGQQNYNGSANYNSYGPQNNYGNANYNNYNQQNNYDQQATYSQQQYGPQTQDNGKGGFAIASFILSICSLFSCGTTTILGLVFGIMGLKSDKKGFATAGIIISAVSMVLAIAIAIIYILIYAGLIGSMFYFEEAMYF